ncbi:UNVERIFIED_CONTAM: hypothetical protein HDU68_004855, partial [Siphonaria sp. JEL0065]
MAGFGNIFRRSTDQQPAQGAQAPGMNGRQPSFFRRRTENNNNDLPAYSENDDEDRIPPNITLNVTNIYITAPPEGLGGIAGGPPPLTNGATNRVSTFSGSRRRQIESGDSEDNYNRVDNRSMFAPRPGPSLNNRFEELPATPAKKVTMFTPKRPVVETPEGPSDADAPRPVARVPAAAANMDDSLFSRQEAIGIPKNAFDKGVLILGIDGSAFEVAKLIRFLGPFKKFVIAFVPDMDGNIEETDLLENIHYLPADVGKSRSETFYKEVKDLIDYGKDGFSLVPLESGFFKDWAAQDDLLATFEGNLHFTYVSCAGSISLSNLKSFNEKCRTQGAGFFATEIRGIMGRFFIDYGNNSETHSPVQVKESSELSIEGANAHDGVIAVPDMGSIGEDATYFDIVLADQTILGENIQVQLYPQNLPPPYFAGDLDCASKGVLVVDNAIATKIEAKLTLGEPVLLRFRPRKVIVKHDSIETILEQFKTEVNALVSDPDASRFAKATATTLKKTNEELDSTSHQNKHAPVYAINSFFIGLMGIQLTQFLAKKPPSMKFHNSSQSIPSTQQLHMFDFSALLHVSPSEGLSASVMKEALGSFRVACIGAGALGVEISKNMIPMGLGKRAGKDGFFKVLDNDTIDISNIVRQFTYNADDARGNRKKSQCLATYMNRRYNNAMEGHYGKLGGFGHEILKNAHVYVSAVDNRQARQVLQMLALGKNVPYVDSGTDVLDIQGSVVLKEVAGHTIPDSEIMIRAANNCLVKPPKTRREVADRAIVMIKEMFENKPS